MAEWPVVGIGGNADSGSCVAFLEAWMVGAPCGEPETTNSARSRQEEPIVKLHLK